MQRYVAVCLPMEVGKWTSVRAIKMQTVLIVCGSVVFYLPRCFEYGVVYDTSRDRYVRLKELWAKSEEYNLIYKVILYYLIIYIIPLSLIFFCTYNLIGSLKEARIKRRRMSTKSRAEEEKKSDFTFSLVIVVIIFIICQLFNPIRRFLYDYFLEEYERVCPYFYHYFQLLSGNVLMFNSAVNFVCYFLSARGFRNKCLARLKPKRMTCTTVELSESWRLSS